MAANPAKTLADERARLQAIKDAAAIPPECGAAIAPAPARGPVVLQHPQTMTPDGADGWKATPGGYRGRTGARVRDAFDAAADQAARAARKDRPPAPPFTPGQIIAGRTYAALYEAVAASGLGAVDLGGGGGGSPGPRGVSEARLRDVRTLWRMQAAIGTGWAISPRRAAPHRGIRRPIAARHLADSFLIGGNSLKHTLERHGWSGSTRNINEARKALAAILDRLRQALDGASQNVG